MFTLMFVYKYQTESRIRQRGLKQIYIYPQYDRTQIRRLDESTSLPLESSSIYSLETETINVFNYQVYVSCEFVIRDRSLLTSASQFTLPLNVIYRQCATCE